MKHNHAEAFRLMTYYGTGKNGTIQLKIWNSRDGVTPFITRSKEYNIELQHVSFHSSEYLPDYKPKKGDLIWRDWRVDEAMVCYGKRYDDIVDTYSKLVSMCEDEIKEKYKYDPRDHLKIAIDEGKEVFVNDCMKSLQPGEPHLELVQEDWK